MHFVRHYRWPLLAGLLVLLALGTRVTVEQRAAYARAVEMEKAGKIDDAIDEYRWALRWYTPWGPAHDDAAAALWDLGNRAAKDNPERAVHALDALRSGLIASRSLWQPRADLVAQVNKIIPALLVRAADRGGDKRDKAKLLLEFTSAYARPIGVGPWTSLAVFLGFCVWIGGLFGVLRRGVDAQGHWLPVGWKWLGGSFVGFAVWTLAMWLG